MIIKPSSLGDFMASLQQYTMQEKFFKWQNYLQLVKQTESPFYQASLENFLEYYPFNHTYWGEIVEQALKVPKTGKANAVRL